MIVAERHEETDPDGSSAVDPEQFRQVLARFAAGVTIVTTWADDVDHAMTATAFSSLSLDPPLVLVCVDKSARFHSAILASGEWAVSILSEDAEAISSWLATRGRQLQDQLGGIGHSRGQTRAALLTDAIGWIECRTWATYEGGDHTIVVGEVLAAELAPDPDRKSVV